MDGWMDGVRERKKERIKERKNERKMTRMTGNLIFYRNRDAEESVSKFHISKLNSIRKKKINFFFNFFQNFSI